MQRMNGKTVENTNSFTDASTKRLHWWKRFIRKEYMPFLVHIVFACAGMLLTFLLCRMGHQRAGGVLLGLTVLGILYGFCLLVLYLTGCLQLLKKQRSSVILFCCLIVIGINAFFAVEMLNQHTVYYWDQADYWRKTIEASQMLTTRPRMLLNNVYVSVNTVDYNLVIPLVLSLPTKIFGTSHVVHILLILNFFLLPGAFVISLAAKNSGGAQKVPLPLLFGLTVLTPALLYPVLAGYLDAFSLLVLSLAFSMVMGKEIFTFKPGRCFCLAVSLILVMLGRRYFCYSVVGLVVAVVCYMVLCTASKQISQKEAHCFGANVWTTAGIAAAVLLLFFRDFIVKAMTNSYAEQYKGYQTGDTLHNFKLFVLYFGILFFVICSADIVVAIMRKDAAYSVSLLVAAFLPAVLLFRVQSMGPHHYYISVLPLLLLQTHLLGCVQDWHRTWKNTVVAAISAVTALNFIFAYVPALHVVRVNNLLGSQRFLPLQRDDMAQLHALCSKVNQVSKASENGKVYMLSASFRLNYSLLQNVNAPATFQAVPNLYASNEVDLRDGFPKQFLKADVVVVCDPIQYATTPETGRVIGLLAKDILHESKISKNYYQEAAFLLTGNTKACIYRRVKTFGSDELSFLESQFNQIYPQWHLKLT